MPKIRVTPFKTPTAQPRRRGTAWRLSNQRTLTGSHHEISEDVRHHAFPSGVVDIAYKIAFPPVNPHLTDPAGWIEYALGEYIWSKQQQICQSVTQHKYTAVKACHGPGKSFIASRIMAWWAEVHPLGSAFVLSTAPTAPQISAILWRELRRTHRVHRLQGRMTLDNVWYMTPKGRRNTASPEDEMIAMGRKPNDYDEAAFQGIHARYVLAVIDEAGGVPKNLYDGINSIVTGDDCRVLAIGNPDDPGSYFADICKPGSGWNVISISAFDTPNFTEEYVPEDVAKQLVTPKWVEERKRDWGEGSPLWVSKILGEFPDTSDEYLFSPDILKTALRTQQSGIEKGQYGADIARFGTDKTVVYRNRGFHVRLEAEWAKKDTMQTVGRIANIVKKHPSQPPKVVIDVVGLGSGVFDRMRELDFPVAPFAASERARNDKRFKNKRAEAYWTFRELCEQGVIDLDPEDDILLNQLGSIKWDVDSSGRIFIESKEDMMKRGLPSPDRADAAVMSTVTNTTARDILTALATKPDTSISGRDILTRSW
jgi:hypothetical protein